MALDRITQFNRWFAGAKAGDSFVYHEGFLPMDKSRVIYLDNGWVRNKPRGETDVIAAMAWLEYLNGGLELTQSKIAEGHYQYIATKRWHVRPVRWIGGRYE